MLQVNTKEMITNLKAVSKGVLKGKNKISILKGMAMEYKKDENLLYFLTYNNDLFISCYMSPKEIGPSADFSIVIADFNCFFNIIKQQKGNIVLKIKENKLIITNESNTNFNILIYSREDFPSKPEMNTENYISLHDMSIDFNQKVTSMIHSAEKSTIKPIFNSVFLKRTIWVLYML